MKKNKVNNTEQYPNFILYDMGIQTAFAQMCQNFQKQVSPLPNPHEDWLIIDNDTGQIITSEKTQT